MKTTKKWSKGSGRNLLLVGISALVLAFGLSAIGCGDSDPDPNPGPGKDDESLAVSGSETENGKELTFTLTGGTWETPFPVYGEEGLVKKAYDITNTDGISVMYYSPQVSNGGKTLTLDVDLRSGQWDYTGTITFKPKASVIVGDISDYTSFGYYGYEIPITGSSVTFTFGPTE
jgi:hypothetical protein